MRIEFMQGQKSEISNRVSDIDFLILFIGVKSNKPNF